MSGITLDLATRPVERLPPGFRPQQAEAPQTRADDIGSLIAEVTNIRSERPSGQAMRAWAPDVPVESRPMVAFAVASLAPAGQPAVAVVIDDMGVDRIRSLRMIELRGPLTMSLMTYADGLQDLAGQARRAGHEVMAHLPMGPVDPAENPGRGALLVSMSPQTIRATLAADLDPWSGYVGINNHMGSKFTADRALMDVVMSELKSRGLLWLDSKTIPGSVGTAAAQAAGVPFIERDVFIDNEQTVPAVLAQLAEAEKIARSRGTAIAIGHPHDATLQALRQWLTGVGTRGVALAPITEVLKRRSSGPQG